MGKVAWGRATGVGCSDRSNRLCPPEADIRLSQREADLRLVRQVVEGAAGALPSLEARVGSVVGGCLGRALRGYSLEAHRDDLAQSFSLFLLEQDGRVLRTYRGEAALTTWIQAVATRYFRAEVRKLRNAASRTRPLDDIAAPAEDQTLNPEEAGTRRQREDAVRRALADLDEEDRLLLALTYVDEAPSRVVGQAMGLSPTGVRMRKKRLFERLARRLEDVW